MSARAPQRSSSRRCPYAEVVAIDLSAETVAQAKAKAAQRGQHVPFLVADIADFGPAARLDLITMLNTPPFLEQSSRSCSQTALFSTRRRTAPQRPSARR